MAGPKQARTGGRRGRPAAPAGNGSAANGSAAKSGGPPRAGDGTGRKPAGRPAAPAQPAAQGRPAPQARVAQGRPAPQAARVAQGRPVPQTRKARDRARARELAQRSDTAEPAAAGPPRWLQLTTLVLAIGGLGVSIYLTIEHFTGNATLACSVNSTFNCDAVTTSPQSKVFGVFPVAVLGLAFYLFMVPATTPWAWRSARREIALARLASVVVGVGFILYLIYVELYQVGYICLWCTSVHVMTFLLFALTVLAVAVWGLPSGAGRGGAARR